MIPFRTFSSHQIRRTSLIPTLILSRSISLSSQFQHESADGKSEKPLEAFFAEAVGLSQNDIIDGEDEKMELKKSLRNLEVELRSNKKDLAKTSSSTFSKPLETLFTEAVGLSKKGGENENDGQESEKGLKTLLSLFTGGKSRKESRKVEESIDFKELSPDMAMFAAYLHSEGYMRNANFLPNNKFDVSCFENKYGRDFLKFAAENFAMDNRDVYKWLPSADLIKVAKFGCPSLGRKNVFSAKSMRLFFGIEEESVCNKCMVKERCEFVKQSVWKKGAKNMDLRVVMRVITLYALEAVPTELQVPDDVKSAVSRLLKEVIRLSKMDK